MGAILQEVVALLDRLVFFAPRRRHRAWLLVREGIQHRTRLAFAVISGRRERPSDHRVVDCTRLKSALPVLGALASRLDCRASPIRA
jgi:hypothetical protein